jgi:hypothetical protein
VEWKKDSKAAVGKVVLTDKKKHHPNSHVTSNQLIVCYRFGGQAGQASS